LGSQVKNKLGARDQIPEPGIVSDIGLMRLHCPSALVLYEIRKPTTEEVVYNHHLTPTICYQAINEMAADEASPAGDDGFHCSLL
jgi:hypothetical protein